MIKPWIVALSVVTLIQVAPPAASAAAPGLPSANVAWLSAAADADVERAFALARAEKKPLLLYWGASWCPPCNQLKATLFNRQDFATLSRSFVAVHVDGDRPGAQKLGQRFKVSGYPTVVLLNPDGAEITRLPGEVDAPQMLAVMQLGLAGGRAVKTVLADARAGKPLTANDWRLLAFYSWETDEQQLLAKAERPATLARLAALSQAGAPAADADTANRLWLKALAASDAADPKNQGLKPDAALRARVLATLQGAAQARVQMDVLTGGAVDIVRALDAEATPNRAALLVAFETALKRLQTDTTLSRGDRLGALIARIDLARLDLPKDQVQVQLPEALTKEVREQVARDDREITDGYQRQAVITAAAYALGHAGLWAESDALLNSNLAKSHSPYYLMSQLGGNARKQGRTDDALKWYGQAFDKSVGPATRLQWGSGYLNALVDLKPENSAQIERTALQLLTEASRDGSAFEGRSARSLKRAGDKLVAWNVAGKQAPVLRRLQAQLDGMCPKVELADGQRAACQNLLAPVEKTSAKPAA